jgi:DNA-binding MarR family transcriptional regulator
VSSASGSERIDGVAFLLAQLGHHAAELFAEQIATIDLTPPHAGILRAIASEPGPSQQALSGQLGLLPSRVVAYVDELEDRGYVERRRNPSWPADMSTG